MKLCQVIVPLLALLLALPASLEARTWTVGRDLNDCGGPCDFHDNSIGADPGEGISRAMENPAVSAGDSVVVYPGEYPFKISMKSGVVLTSANGVGTVTISGSAQGEAAITMVANSGLTVVEQMVISWDAISVGIGGGVSALVSSGTIQQNIFVNCNAGIGAGVHQQLSDVTVRDNVFIRNTCTSGGGVIALSGSPALIQNNTFYASEASFGADGSVFYSTGSEPTFDRNVIVGSQGAPAVYCEGLNDVTVSCNMFWNNQMGAFGGGCSNSIGVAGNVVMNPLLCSPQTNNFGYCVDSPAIAGACGFVGYTSPNGTCPACQPTSVEEPTHTSWGRLKVQYR